MKKVYVGLICLLALSVPVRAAEEQTTQTSGQSAKPPRHSGYARVTDEDKAMERAVEHAQRSLGFFIAALRAKKAGDTTFEIKKGCVDGDKCEHLWISDVTYDGKNFHGRISNRPLEVTNVHLGQRVTVAPREVSDWMFLKDGKLMGGYTTRVLYARLSPEEKAQFDKEADFKVE